MQVIHLAAQEQVNRHQYLLSQLDDGSSRTEEAVYNLKQDAKESQSYLVLLTDLKQTTTQSIGKFTDNFKLHEWCRLSHASILFYPSPYVTIAA